MKAKNTTTARQIAERVKQGEGPALEFKRSTGELKEAMQTLCAFLNGAGGTVPIEKWGRGTNRVIAMCRAAGIRPPEFAEVGPPAVVTLKVPVAGSGTTSRPVEAPVSLHATDRTILDVLGTGECGKSDLLKHLGHAQRSGNFKKAIEKLLTAQMIERTIPDKPNSRLQKYRLTAKGKAILEKPK